MKKQFPIDCGRPFPLGPSQGPGWSNFSLFSRHAESVTLVFAFIEGPHRDQVHEIRLDPKHHRSGDIWHVRLMTEGSLRYGYRLNGSDNPSEGMVFFPDRILIDPYCRQLVARPWQAAAAYGRQPVCLLGLEKPFDWQADRPLRIPAADTVIYELHVRGFTRHASAQVTAPGTFRGIIEKIDYLKALGITAIELLPITAWDETDNKFLNPVNGGPLLNFWGYNPLNFFALHAGLAADPANHRDEFKTMVRSLHQAGIEVIIDMVFNHTAESDSAGITSSFRGIDNAIYYLIDRQTGDYLNFSGCGNTVSCNHPVVRRLIIDALRYWVEEMHVDGFRFDLAAIFSRGKDGELHPDPPLIEEIAEDPLLRETKIIAEAWDASGLYQVGSFASDPRWMEWNGRFRDDIRRFLSDQPDTVSALASRLAGSSDLYEPSGRGPLSSVNYLTSHDGFTLYDLVSYNEKDNHANGEENRDGENHNLSWNSGYEGDPCPAEVRLLRFRRIRTFIGLLLFSQGVPMLTAGDEFGRTQLGNNNSWCQDNPIGWVDWSLADTNQDLLRFTRFCVALRKEFRCFRRDRFFPQDADKSHQHPEITWQSLQPGKQDWSDDCRTLAWLLHDPADKADFFIMLNGSRTAEAAFVVPNQPPRQAETVWRMIIDSGAAPPNDCHAADAGDIVDAGSKVIVVGMGLVVLQTTAADAPYS